MRMSLFRHGVMLVVAAAMLPGSVRAGGQDPPQVRSRADHVAACAQLPTAKRDVCLAGRAMRSEDLGLCAAARSQGCADLVAMIAMAECYHFPGDGRRQCELAVASKLDSTKACKAATTPDDCLVGVAAERGDPNLVVSGVKDSAQRDRLLGQYAALTRDDSVLARISDPIIYNKIVVYLAPIMMNKPGFTLTPEWCRKMKALPAGTDESDVVGATPAFCRLSVALSQRVAQAMDSTETERERKQVAAAFAAAVNAMATNAGGLSIDDFVGLLDPTYIPSSAFAGAWLCPDRGTLTLTVDAGDSVTGAVSGRPTEHWGGAQRKGGGITGTARDGLLKIDMNSGDGTVSHMEATLGANGKSFSGGWTWFRGTTKLGSGTWGCQRPR